jgi:tRNA modification GTPase
VYRRLRDPLSGAELDDGLVLWFPAPASETGEDVAELQIHGGRATVAAVLEALAELPDLRIAEPGEFTRRAFFNGKLDLTAVEGLADLVNAETDAQRRQALRQLKGELGCLYDAWRTRLVRLLAYAEATIDFPDEVGETGGPSSLLHEILMLIREITQHLDDKSRGERLRGGLYVAIVGPPNVGKSSLLNALAKRDVAIVSEVAGTTRDVIEVHLDLAGYPVLLADTAGIRESSEAIEREGVRRALARAEEADLRLVMVDGTQWPAVPSEIDPVIDHRSILILNKVDLVKRPLDMMLKGRPIMALSVVTGEGMGELVSKLEQEAVARMAVAETPTLTRLRHRQALERCVEALGRSTHARLPELAAEDLRLAARELGRITGRVDVEDLLDVIFHDFCIGK